MPTEKDKPRVMTVRAIENRFEAGSWDHADLAFLYARAKLAAELVFEGEAVITEFFSQYEHEEKAPDNPTVRALRRLEAVIRKAKAEK